VDSCDAGAISRSRTWRERRCIKHSHSRRELAIARNRFVHSYETAKMSPAEGTSHLARHRRKRAFSKRRKGKSGQIKPRLTDGLSMRGSYVETVNCCRRLPNDALTRWFHTGRSKDGETGSFARLRIPKSSISKRSSPFPPIADLREENAIFHDQSRVHDRFDRAVWNRCVSCNCICD
jgi:hypothetical protein